MTQFKKLSSSQFGRFPESSIRDVSTALTQLESPDEETKAAASAYLSEAFRSYTVQKMLLNTEGVIDKLVSLGNSQDPTISATVLNILENLTHSEDGRKAILKNPKAIDMLEAQIKSPNPEIYRYASLILRNLANSAEGSQAMLDHTEVITTLKNLKMRQPEGFQIGENAKTILTALNTTITGTVARLTLELEHPQTSQNAAHHLARLSSSDLGIRAMARNSKCKENLSSQVKQGSPETKKSASLALVNLFEFAGSQAMSHAMQPGQGVLQEPQNTSSQVDPLPGLRLTPTVAIVKSLASALENRNTVRAALFNLRNLSCSKDGIKAISGSNTNIIPTLLSLIDNDSPINDYALATLCNLVASESMRRDILKCDGIIDKLVSFIDSTSHTTESVAGTRCKTALLFLRNLTCSKDGLEATLNKENSNVTKTIETLVSLAANENIEISKQASAALVGLSSVDKGRKAILKCKKKAIETLVSLLTNTDKDISQNALIALDNLSCSRDGRTAILKHGKGVIGKVGPFLAPSNTNINIKRCALRVLVNLSSSDQGKNDIINTPGMIEQLLPLMDPSNNAAITDYAAATFGNLAFSKAGRSAINKVIKSLVSQATQENADPEISRKALLTLGNSVHFKAVRDAILRCKGSIDRLVLLGATTSANEAVRSGALRTIGNLAITNKGRKAICKCEGCIDKLVSLVKDPNDLIKKDALYNLQWLALSNNGIRAILKCEGAIGALISLVSTSPDPIIQEAALCALANLANSDKAQKAILASGMVETLQALIKSPNEGIQHQALRTLAKVAYLDEGCAAILNTDILTTVVSLVGRSNTDTNRAAICVLESLSASKGGRMAILTDDTKSRILGRLQDQYESTDEQTRNVAYSAVCRLSHSGTGGVSSSSLVGVAFF